MNEEVINKYVGCCNRQMPSTSVLLGSAIDPENLEQGVRANIHQPQVDDLIQRITTSVNTTIKEESSNIVDAVNDPERPTLTTTIATLGTDGEDGDTYTTPDGAVGLSIYVRSGSATLTIGDRTRTLLSGESLNLGDDAYKIQSVVVATNPDSSALIITTEK